MADALDLDKPTCDKVEEILLPHVSGGERERRVLLSRAFGMSHALTKLTDYSGNDSVFVFHLIERLCRYGILERTREQALALLLVTIRERCGVGGQVDIDALCLVINGTAALPPSQEPHAKTQRRKVIRKQPLTRLTVVPEPPEPVAVVVQPPADAEPATPKPLSVFLCYAREDLARVRDFATWLRTLGVEPWLDVEKLRPGHKWKTKIQRAQRDSAVTCVCLSAKSVGRESFTTTEIGEALEIAEARPDDQICVIPIKFDECAVPVSLLEYHYQDFFGETLPDAQRLLWDSLVEAAESNNCILPLPLPAPKPVSPPTLPRVKRIREPIPPPVAAAVVPTELSTTKTNPRDGAELIWIPPGDFLMGDSDQSDNPRRMVHLDGYHVYKTPVTWAQYETFCEETKRRLPDAPSWGRQSDHPVVNVSWHDAQAYCEWAGGWLPTEAQWEKTARGTDGRKFPWGETWDANLCHCSKKGWGDAKRTARVGMYPKGASPFGALDMSGNVWEWCADVYDAEFYKTAPLRNPFRDLEGAVAENLSPGAMGALRSLLGMQGKKKESDSSNVRRACRGGSWSNHDGGNFRASFRLRYAAGLLGDVVGFRCALSPNHRYKIGA